MNILNNIRTLFSKRTYKNRVKNYNKKINGKIKLAVLYYIPKSQKSKYNNWTDGFTKGIDLLSKDVDITWINLEDEKPDANRFNSFDFILVKSCWGWIVDRYLRNIENLNTPRGIIVSCSIPPQSNKILYFYDIVWYETAFYEKYIKKHPMTFHAFGIDKSSFNKQHTTTEKDIDVLSIGAFQPYKRLDKMISINGKKKVIVGNTKTSYFNEISPLLKKEGVDVIDYLDQVDMAKLIHRTKLVYIPAELNGGGERAVLEARACGVPVKVEDDNPKLIELCNSPIWDEYTTYKGFKKGLFKFFNLTETE